MAPSLIDDVTRPACPLVVERLSDRSVASGCCEEALRGERRRLQRERISQQSLRGEVIKSVEHFYGSHGHFR